VRLAPTARGVEHYNARVTRPALIVAAAVVKKHGTVLVTQRKKGKHLAGAWEFPGGKVLPGEDPRDALVRELREELGVEALVGDALEVTWHRYPEHAVLLLFFETELARGSPAPEPLDVAAIKWASPKELASLEMPPADRSIVGKVKDSLARRGAGRRGLPTALSGSFARRPRERG
jgi:8-oxo-dGTP diphosphatase